MKNLSEPTARPVYAKKKRSRTRLPHDKQLEMWPEQPYTEHVAVPIAAKPLPPPT
jgi:hypothetical protein